MLDRPETNSRINVNRAVKAVKAPVVNANPTNLVLNISSLEKPVRLLLRPLSRASVIKKSVKAEIDSQVTAMAFAFTKSERSEIFAVAMEVPIAHRKAQKAAVKMRMTARRDFE